MTENHKLKYINGFSSEILLKGWITKNSIVEVYANTGAKVTGILKYVGTYDIVLIDVVDDKKYIIFKSNIFYISRIKEVKNASVQ